MNIKQIYISANKKVPISDKLVQDTKEKIASKFAGYSIKYRVPRYAVLVVCALLALAIIIPNINNIIRLNNANGRDTGTTNTKYGLDMSYYYRCNGSYYSFIKREIVPSFQTNISKRIYGDYYQINGVNPSKSIALFSVGYYYQLDYAFKDTITYMGKPYLLDANSMSDREGKDLNYSGNVDQYKIYKVAGSDISSKIAVKLISSDIAVQIMYLLHPVYVYAYQYPSTVNMSGITYELGTSRNMIADNKTEGDYLGMASQYKAYSNKNSNKNKQENNTIFLHLNDTEEVRAKAISLPDDSPIPVSRYGTAIEAMFPIDSIIHWKNHGFYMYQSILSDSAKDQLGNMLYSYSDDNGHNYAVYEMKDVDTTKCTIVQNNNVYLKYNFMFTDTIIFNGRTYFIRDTMTNGNYIKGDKIGQFGSIDIYEFKGIDPAKQICVPMTGPPIPAGETGATLGSGDLIAYSE